MSRETEKIMKELQQFLALHGDEATDEESVNRLTRQFLWNAAAILRAARTRLQKLQTTI